MTDPDALIYAAIHETVCAAYDTCLGDEAHKAISELVEKLSTLYAVTNVGGVMGRIADKIVSDDTAEELHPGLHAAMEILGECYASGIRMLNIPYMNMN